MDPLSVLRTMWRQKWVALPVVILTIVACAYVYLFAPRTYEAAVTYALSPPSMPTAEERLSDKSLAKLNEDNPYLRSDNSLLIQVIIAKLTDPAYVEGLREQGLATDFTIAPISSGSSGLVSIVATSESDEEAIKIAGFLGTEFTNILHDVQKINGADDRFLYQEMLVRGPGPAIEQYSSRLRSVIMVGIAGGIVLFAAVSVAQSIRSRNSGGSGRGGHARSLEPHPGNFQLPLADLEEYGKERRSAAVYK